MKYLIQSASLLAIALSTTPVFAQAAADDTGLADIVVTAQKRVEVAQKAPLAITSLNADALANARVTSAAELQRVVPNLHAQAGAGVGDPAGGNTLFSIRGLGASPTGTQGSAGVAAHFDGVYRQSGISGAEFFDIERIEVAPGPQGTLYGRSAAAGAVNIISNKPTNVLEGSGTIEYGNYNTLRTEGAINLPIGDSFALRAAFQTQRHDGYYSNGYDDLDSKSFRLQALFKPDDKLTVRLFGSFSRLQGKGGGNVFINGPVINGIPGIGGVPSLRALFPSTANTDLRKASISEYCIVEGAITRSCDQDVINDKYSIYADINYDLGWGVLTLLPAYNEADQSGTKLNAPLPLSFYNQEISAKQYNFEARLNSASDSRVKWVVGASYYDNSTQVFNQQSINILSNLAAPSPPAPPGTSFPGVVAISANFRQASTQRASAVFGQITYPISDALRVTVGARYNHDTSGNAGIYSNLSTRIFALNGPNIATPLAPPGVSTPLLTASQSFNAFTYRVAIDADIGPSSLLYASVGSGYKPGGLNDGGPPQANIGFEPAIAAGYGITLAQVAAVAPAQFFGPEKVTHFEIGSKNRFLNNKLQINNIIYYDDYANYQNGQTQVVNPLIFRTQGFVVTNAGKARVYGDEFSIKYQASRNDVIDISVNYLNATFTSYVTNPFLSPSALVPSQSFTGRTLPNAPKFSGNISYQHTFELNGGSEIVAGVFSNISGSYWLYFAQTPGTFQKAYTNTALNLSWTSANRRLKVAGFVSNIEDHQIRSYGGFTAGYSQIGLVPPRTFGGSISYKF